MAPIAHIMGDLARDERRTYLCGLEGRGEDGAGWGLGDGDGVGHRDKRVGLMLTLPAGQRGEGCMGIRAMASKTSPTTHRV
jgi:hypothetical protein